MLGRPDDRSLHRNGVAQRRTSGMVRMTSDEALKEADILLKKVAEIFTCLENQVVPPHDFERLAKRIRKWLER